MKISPQIKDMMPHLDPAVRQMMVDYILTRKDEEGKKVKLNNIYKGFPLEQRRKIRKIVKDDAGKMIKAAIWPLETAIHDFAVELLRGLESAYILDNNKEVARLRREVGSAVRAIQTYSGEGADEARNVLTQQLEKIKHLDNIDSAVEGFVFIHDDQMYKFTGNFAPVNQILGLFKYGRGSVPAIKRTPAKAEEPQELDELEQVPQNGPERVVAVLPGAFKPPHKGHFDMALHYAGVADVVYVYISRIPRDNIDFETSRLVWNTYKAASKNPDASKIEVIGKPSENASPVGAAYEFVGNKNADPQLAQPGDLVILAASDKPDDKGAPDFMRFKGGGQYFGQGVLGGEEDPSTGIPIETLKNRFKITDDEPLSARNLRKAIQQNDDEVIRRYLPEDVITNDQALASIFDILDVVGHGRSLTMETLIKLVEAQLPDKVHAKAAKIEKEGKPRKQAYAIAASMEEEGELEEITTMSGGGIAVAQVSSDKNETSWDKKATQKFNRKAAKDQRLKGTKLTEEELIEKVLHYLVTRGAAK